MRHLYHKEMHFSILPKEMAFLPQKVTLMPQKDHFVFDQQGCASKNMICASEAGSQVPTLPDTLPETGQVFMCPVSQDTL